MRFLAWLCITASTAGLGFGAPPPELASALKSFRSDPPREWSYTQTTSSAGRSTVERYEAGRPEYARWSLVQKDGRPPTEIETREYLEARSRRSRTGTAPGIVDQLVLDRVETVGETPERTTFRCPLRPGESRDKTALHLRATIVLHKRTQTIEAIELANVEPFNPTFGVKITRMRTLMSYSLREGDAPSLPQKVTTLVRGAAFIFKSLDADLTVTYSDYSRAVARPR